MSTLALPRPLGRYILLRRLATGGMAEVYLAKSKGAGGFEKLVAIKRVHPFHAKAGGEGSLSDEAKLSVELSHANIVRTFDLDRADGTEFIVMERVEGYDAQHVIDSLRRNGADFPIELAAHVIAQVCRGLDYAHRKCDADGKPAGIVHRDVSPQNILLSFTGEVKLADFGIAKTNARRSDPETRVIKGKYFYMSPEQARASSLDRRTDVFSAGVVLWELLCGRRLYDAPDVETLLERARRAQVPPPSSVRAAVPPELDAIVSRATRMRPEERFRSAAAMRDALESYLAARPPNRAAPAVGALVSALPEPTVASVPPPSPGLPKTRDRIATESMAGQSCPAEPSFGYDLGEGEPTLIGWQCPGSSAADHRWMWTLVVGGALVWLAAWWLAGS